MTDQRPDLLEGTGRAGPTLYQRWGMGKHMCASPAVCFLSFTATARRLTVAPGGDLDRKSRGPRPEGSVPWGCLLPDKAASGASGGVSSYSAGTCATAHVPLPRRGPMDLMVYVDTTVVLGMLNCHC